MKSNKDLLCKYCKQEIPLSFEFRDTFCSDECEIQFNEEEKYLNEQEQ